MLAVDLDLNPNMGRPSGVASRLPSEHPSPGSGGPFLFREGGGTVKTLAIAFILLVVSSLAFAWEQPEEVVTWNPFSKQFEHERDDRIVGYTRWNVFSKQFDHYGKDGRLEGYTEFNEFTKEWEHRKND